MTSSKIIFNPYASATLLGFDTERVLKAYREYWNNDSVRYEGIVSGQRRLNFVKDIKFVVSEHTRVPPFIHPIVSDGTILLDIRSYSKYDKINRQIMITDYSRFRLDMIRAMLMNFTVANHVVDDILIASKLPALVYATAINNIITSRHPLEAEAGQTIQILALMYYINKFYKDNYWADSDRVNKGINKYARPLRINPSEVMRLAGLKIPLNTLEELTDAIKEHANTNLLENIDPGTLLTLSTSLWWGPNRGDLVAVALDDPATLIAMCYSAIMDHNYKNTKIGLIAKIYKNDSDQFTDYISYFVKTIEQ